MFLQPKLGRFVCGRGSCLAEPRCPECSRRADPTIAGWECRACLCAIERCPQCSGTGTIGFFTDGKPSVLVCTHCLGLGEALSRVCQPAEVGDER